MARSPNFRCLDRQPTSRTDSIPFAEKFLKQYCHRLYEVAAPNLSRRFTSWDSLFREIINELSRLHLHRHDLSSMVAASADVVKRKLVARGVSDVEGRWSTYAHLPREYSTGSSSRCVCGSLVLSASAAICPQVQSDIVAAMHEHIRCAVIADRLSPIADADADAEADGIGSMCGTTEPNRRVSRSTLPCIA